MILGSDSEATGPEKDGSEVIIESEELMLEIDDILLLFEILRLWGVSDILLI